jgi:hypothetical protein
MKLRTALVDEWTDPEVLDLLEEHALTRAEVLMRSTDRPVTDSGDAVRRHFARRSVQPR